MPVHCYACAHFSAKDTSGGKFKIPAGFGVCAQDTERGRYMAALYPRECANFKQADDMTVRQAWAKKRTKGE